MTRVGGRPPAEGGGAVRAPALPTALTEVVGCRYPIVQTGMGWVSGPELVVATAEAGGLGILASATMTLDGLAAAVRAVRERTAAPFGVNLRSDADDAEQRVDLLIREGVRVASFALAPRPELIARLRDAGVVVVPTVGARRHAEKVASWGADAVIAQGGEGGGHTGAEATSVLLPRVVDAVDIPVVAAGGFFDGRGLAAALAYGAAGVAMGTRFLLTSDSVVPDAVKRRYLESAETVVTRQVDGLPHRVLRSHRVDALERSSGAARLVRALRDAAAFRRLSGRSWPALLREGRTLRRSGGLTWSQVLMAATTPMALKAAMADGRTDLGVMASGQAVAAIDDLPSCAELIDRTVTEAHATLARLATLLPAERP